MSSPFDGLLRAVGGFAEGAAGTGEKIMGEQQAQRDREATIEKQDALTLQREQTMAEFRQGMEQKSLGAQHQSRMKAGQDIEDTYRTQLGEGKPQARMDELKAREDIANRKGYFDHAKQLREQQDVLNKERKLDIDERRAESIERNVSGGNHDTAENKNFMSWRDTLTPDQRSLFQGGMPSKQDWYDMKNNMIRPKDLIAEFRKQATEFGTFNKSKYDGLLAEFREKGMSMYKSGSGKVSPESTSQPSKRMVWDASKGKLVSQ